MSTAAILICTTLVTNAANGSIVTRECNEVLPPTAMASPESAATGNTEQPAPQHITNIILGPIKKSDELAATKEEAAVETVAEPTSASTVSAPIASAPIVSAPIASAPIVEAAVAPDVEPAAEPVAETVAAPIIKPPTKPITATAKRVKPRRVKLASYSPSHQKRRVTRPVRIAQTASNDTQQPKKLTFWQRLRNLDFKPLIGQ